MFKVWILLKLSLTPFLFTATFAVNAETLNLVEAQWSADTAYESSTQLHIAVIKTVLKDHYTDFSITREPFKRALHSTSNQKYDILLVTFSSDYAPRAGLQTSAEPIDAARIVAATKKTKAIVWQDVLDKPQLYKIGWINGYAYDRLLGIKPTEQLPKGDLGLKMLVQNRLDVFIDDYLGLQIPLNGELEQLKSAIQLQEVYTLPLYPSFAQTPSGLKLLKLFDRQISEPSTRKALVAVYKSHKRDYQRILDSAKPKSASDVTK